MNRGHVSSVCGNGHTFRVGQVTDEPQGDNWQTGEQGRSDEMEGGTCSAIADCGHVGMWVLCCQIFWIFKKSEESGFLFELVCVSAPELLLMFFLFGLLGLFL